jgi:hypothetical protein
MHQPSAPPISAIRLLSAFLFLTIASTAAAQSTTTYVYPLKVSANGRYLVDQSDVPWRVQADAAWFLSTSATPEQVDVYLATRKAQGFNSFYLMAMVPARWVRGRAAGAGQLQRGSSRSPLGPVFDGGASRGLGAILAGHRRQSSTRRPPAAWSSCWRTPTSDTREAARAGTRRFWPSPACRIALDWGFWLGTRYKGKSNLIWFALGDYTPPAGSEGEARALAIIAGIKAAGAEQLFMAEPSGGAAVPTIDAPRLSRPSWT